MEPRDFYPSVIFNKPSMKAVTFVEKKLLLTKLSVACLLLSSSLLTYCSDYPSYSYIAKQIKNIIESCSEAREQINIYTANAKNKPVVVSVVESNKGIMNK